MAACFVACALLASCSIKAGKSPWQEDKALIMKSLDESYRIQAKTAEQLQALQGRVMELEKDFTSQSSKLAALEASVKGISNSNNTQMKREITRQKKSNLDLVKKIDKITANIDLASRSATQTGTSKIDAQDDANRNADDEKNRYTSAYLAFKSGRYDEASLDLTTLVADYPDGEYTDQAYYWLGESFEAQRKTDMAIAAYRMIVNKHPDSTKGAAALLNLGLIYRQVKRPNKMHEALQLLLSRHPDSPEAERARALLEALDSGQRK